MKKLGITKESFEKSEQLLKEYGKLKYVSENGRLYKTDKGKILKFVKEAREYINDQSIETDTAEEFIIFDDPDIFNKIAKAQKDKAKEVQDEVKKGDATPKEVANTAKQTSNVDGAVGQVASSAINATANIATSKTVMGLAAAAGYKKILDKAGEIGDELGDKIGGSIGDAWFAKDNEKADAINQQNKEMSAKIKKGFEDLAKGTNLNPSNEKDKRALYVAQQLMSGGKILGGGAKKTEITPEVAKEWLAKNGYELGVDGIVKKITGAATTARAAQAAMSWLRAAGAAASTGAAASGTAAATTATAASAAEWSLFGMSAATLGWVTAGVAAAALITPYIYDKIRACTKTWMADIIAEVKFKADGKNYRCFYDIKKNKWVLIYSDLKWTSYLDNKLDKETKEEFFSSNFFRNFLNKCKNTFALLFSTGRNEVVFKTLPEIKDAPKELKEILEKIYDNKGAISKNMFSGEYES